MTTAQTVRKTAQRKAITKEIKALHKMMDGIVKLRSTIADNSTSIHTVDIFNQISGIYSQLDTAVTVVDAAIQDKAHELARTFTTK